MANNPRCLSNYATHFHHLGSEIQKGKYPCSHIYLDNNIICPYSYSLTDSKILHRKFFHLHVTHNNEKNKTSKRKKQKCICAMLKDCCYIQAHFSCIYAIIFPIYLKRPIIHKVAKENFLNHSVIGSLRFKLDGEVTTTALWKGSGIWNSKSLLITASFSSLLISFGDFL